MYEVIYNFGGYNQKLFYLINSLFVSDYAQIFFTYFTILFNIEVFALSYILLSIILLAVIYHRQNYEEYSVIYHFMTKIGFAYALFGFIYAAMKFGINLPRPFCSLPEGSFNTIIAVESERCLSSFPSAHTGLAVLILLFCWRYINNTIKICGIITILLVAVSRIALAMHYPSDILYSIIIAYIIYKLSLGIYKMIESMIFLPIKDFIWSKIDRTLK